MSIQTLRDRHYKILGHIETMADGRQVAKNVQYKILGHYDPRTDQTRDVQYRVVGQGNLVASLIVQL